MRVNKGHVLGGAALLAPVFAVFMSKALAPLFVAAGVFGLAAELAAGRRFPRLSPAFTALFAGVVLWGLASAIWSISPPASLHLVLPLTATFFCGLVLIALARTLSPEERAFVEKAILMGVALGAALLLVEASFELVLTGILRRWVYGYELQITYRFPNYLKPGASLMALLIWPAVAILCNRGRGAWGYGVVVAGLGLFYLTETQGAFLGLLVGAVAFAAARLAGPRIAGILAALVVLVVALAPLAPRLVPPVDQLARSASFLPDSVFPRLFIWKSAARHIAEAPLLGKGLNASRQLSTEADRVLLPGNDGQGRLVEPIPLHPHSAVFQVWLELGGVGALMLVLLLGRLLMRIPRLSTGSGAAAGIGAFFTGLAIAGISYGIWQSWWLSALWLAAAFTAATLTPRETSDP